MTYLFRQNNVQKLCINSNKYDEFQPLEFVGRASETQLQVGENLNDLIKHFKGNTGNDDTLKCFL